MAPNWPAFLSIDFSDSLISFLETNISNNKSPSLI